jgi:hypothetical protein
MTVAIFVTEKQVDLLHAFIERANARAYLWSIGEYALHEAVDQLEADALRDGLNRAHWDRWRSAVPRRCF